MIPYPVAMELLLTGSLITADAALKYGLLNYVVPQNEVLNKALDIARTIAANGPVAVQCIRQAARGGIGRPEAEALEIEQRCNVTVRAHPDSVEGPRAFMEKRKPVWTTAKL
jgi:enoyl-CoA hydratase